MNKVEVSGRIPKSPYNGKAKAGPYVAGQIEVGDEFKFWVDFYAPAEAGKVMSNASVDDKFKLEGELTQNKRTLPNGDVERKIQIKVLKAVQLGSTPAKKYGEFDPDEF